MIAEKRGAVGGMWGGWRGDGRIAGMGYSTILAIGAVEN
jgi:hypothetical protein